MLKVEILHVLLCETGKVLNCGLSHLSLVCSPDPSVVPCAILMTDSTFTN